MISANKRHEQTCKRVPILAQKSSEKIKDKGVTSRRNGQFPMESYRACRAHFHRMACGGILFNDLHLCFAI